MINKWADYGISEVQYNGAHTHITKVKVCPDKGEEMGTESIWTRAEVIRELKDDSTFVTVLKGSENKWKKGQPVFIVEIGGEKYIKTVSNSKTVDNLGDLPEF